MSRLSHGASWGQKNGNEEHQNSSDTYVIYTQLHVIQESNVALSGRRQDIVG